MLAMKNTTPPTSLRHEVPMPEVARLPVHDVHQAERPGHEHDAHHREAHGQLVGDHLGTGPQRAEQRVVAVGRPAGQDDPVQGDGPHGQEQHQAGVEVRYDVVEAVAEDSWGPGPAPTGPKGSTAMTKKAGTKTR